MDKKLNLKFANVIYGDTDKSFSEERKLIRKAYNRNKKFFDIEIPLFEVVLVYSRKEFDKQWGGKTADFVSGFSRDGKIVIFSQSIFNKETRWRKKDFYPCLVHEMCHAFYEELRDDSFDPLWLSEGLATLMQNGRKKLIHKKTLKITKKILNIGFNEMGVESYHVHYLFTRYLMRTFGKSKLLKFIKLLRKGGKQEVAFKKTYKMSFDDLINDANQHKKTS